MNKHLFFLYMVLMASVPSTPSPARQSANTIRANRSAASPEMDRLTKALAGTGTRFETMERGKFFPNGGSRRGIVHVRLAAGGNTLIYEVHSDGSLGNWMVSTQFGGTGGQSSTTFCLFQQSQ